MPDDAARQETAGAPGGAWQRRKRWERRSEALDAAERQWWERYADVEDEFCWVQTRWIRRLLRGEYVRTLARAIPPEGRVLEIGCGSGWLARELARSGAAEVYGVEFSP
ncbi:MAG: class I SAM-dependent methyltransferase, partial [Actinomycetota bacterium]